jgi:hypothetical protein
MKAGFFQVSRRSPQRYDRQAQTTSDGATVLEGWNELPTLSGADQFLVVGSDRFGRPNLSGGINHQIN